MAANDLFNLTLIVLILLLCTLSHILDVLLFVKGYFHRAAVGIHALQYLPIVHTCLEKCRVERKVDALLDALMLFEWVDTLML